MAVALWQQFEYIIIRNISFSLSLSADTTRPIRPGEVHGHTYHFSSREEFEDDILHERFLEYQETKGYYFGTSVSAVKKIVESGRVPVVDLQPQVREQGMIINHKKIIK